MEELDLDRTPLPKVVWTPTKYKPPASKKTSIKYNIAYRFNKQQKANGPTVLSGYKLVSEVKTKKK